MLVEVHRMQFELEAVALFGYWDSHDALRFRHPFTIVTVSELAQKIRQIEQTASNLQSGAIANRRSAPTIRISVEQ